MLRRAVERGTIGEEDLLTTESEVIAKLLADPETADLWNGFRACRRMKRADRPGATGEWRKIDAKRRAIDPMVMDRGRVSAICPDFADALSAFRSDSLDYWICGEGSY